MIGKKTDSSLDSLDNSCRGSVEISPASNGTSLVKAESTANSPIRRRRAARATTKTRTVSVALSSLFGRW